MLPLERPQPACDSQLGSHLAPGFPPRRRLLVRLPLGLLKYFSCGGVCEVGFVSLDVFQRGIDSFTHAIAVVPRDVVLERHTVHLASSLSCFAHQLFGFFEELVRKRNRYFHTFSITQPYRSSYPSANPPAERIALIENQRRVSIDVGRAANRRDDRLAGDVHISFEYGADDTFLPPDFPRS